ncbi:hypothetical protein [Flagellimonas sp.]|uniref:hypothetical protein n=1 Tax=Flagellimonas sp. TaxID=2058762 RepID=UPI003BAC2A4A
MSCSIPDSSKIALLTVDGQLKKHITSTLWKSNWETDVLQRGSGWNKALQDGVYTMTASVTEDGIDCCRRRLRLIYKANRCNRKSFRWPLLCVPWPTRPVPEWN